MQRKLNTYGEYVRIGNMRAIKIDAEKEDIYEVEHDGSLESIYNHLGLGCHTFAIGAQVNQKDDIFVDDEGLLHPIKAAFRVRGHPQPFFAGNGLVVGHNEMGEAAGAKTDLNFLKEMISFSPNKWATSQPKEEEPSEERDEP